MLEWHAPPQGAGGFQSGKTGADHEDDVIGLFGGDSFGMLASASLLAHYWVLGAPDRGATKVMGETDVPAEALSNVIQTAFFYPLGEEWVGTSR